MLLKVLKPAEQGQPHTHKKDPPPKETGSNSPLGKVGSATQGPLAGWSWT